MELLICAVVIVVIGFNYRWLGFRNPTAAEVQDSPDWSIARPAEQPTEAGGFLRFAVGLVALVGGMSAIAFAMGPPPQPSWQDAPELPAHHLRRHAR